MTNPYFTTTGVYATSLQRFFAALLLLLPLIALQAQSGPLDGSTSPGMAPGAPAGSYPLSDLDSVNLFNGHLGFHLPLVQVGGRGGAGSNIVLAIEQAWIIQHVDLGEFGTLDYADPNWWQARAGYAPGKMDVRKSGEPGSCSQYAGGPTIQQFSASLTRLTFTAPDNTEYELRDTLNGGRPLSVTGCGASIGPLRGTVFVSADGTGVTFVSDAPVYDGVTEDNFSTVFGNLFLRDGTEYRIDNNRITRVRDRNGNTVSFTYDSGGISIKDSLNRLVTITYHTGYDLITSHGFGGATWTMRVHHAALSGLLRSDFSPQQALTYAELFPNLNGADAYDGDPFGPAFYNPTLVSAVELPDERQYKFYYNHYGELARTELPTGGAVEYDFAVDVFDRRTIVARRVYANGETGNNFESKTTYAYSYVGGGYNPPSTGTTTAVVDHLGPNGALLGREKHYFHGLPLAGGGATSYAYWKDGREYQTELFATDGVTLLQRTTQTWQQGPTGWSWWGPPNGFQAELANNPRVVETNSTLCDVSPNLITKQTFNYDQYNNRTDVYEYDYGAGNPPGAPTRHQHTDYLTTNPVNGSIYDNPPGAGSNGPLVHLRSLPAQVSVYDAGGTERARTTYEYDNYGFDGNHAGLLGYANISGFDSSFTTSYTTRGNVTGTTQYLLNGSGQVVGSISAYAQYDVAGNVVKAIDARGNTTLLDFTDRFGAPDGEARAIGGSTELNSAGQYSYAFATKATNALGHTAYTQFDYYLGRPVDAEDANGAVTSMRYGTVENDTYVDLMDRPTQLIRGANPDNPTHSQTTTKYDDANHLITTTSDRDSYQDNLLKSQTLYDGLGRTVRALTYENQDPNNPWLTTDTQYDALGRAWRGSNPYRSTGYSAAVNPSGLWTTTAFDALGRGVSVTTPDNAVVSSYYSGNQVLVKDQAGKERMSQSNALGQLSDVWEITTADDSTEGITFPNRTEVTNGYRTRYVYDTLGNLTTVTQRKGTGGTLQTRTFAYDSLNRLLSAGNPESGSINYINDSNGNLVVKTDARGVSSHYEYDLLNRATRRWYNGGNSVSNTVNNSPALPGGVGASDEVKYLYDSATMPSGAPTFTRGSATGRLVATTYGGGSSGNYFGYDELGQTLLSIQQTGGINYETDATYNKAGALLTETYPSRRVVTNTYDAAGRTASVAGNLGDATSRTYAAGILYSPFGGITIEQFGTDTVIYNKLQYNVRGQLWDVRVSTGSDPNGTWNRGCLQSFYDQAGSFGGSGPDNNGNVIAAKHYRPLDDSSATWAISTDYYNYDSLNRLALVREFYGSGQPETQQFAQAYVYDRYGNRTIDAGSTWGTGINNKQFDVSTTSNRLSVPSGQTGTMTYDSVGNLTVDTYSGFGVTREYDGDNRMTKETQTGSYVAGVYTYNADGQRVRRKVGATETWQVYGMDGELLAEYAASGATTSPQKEYGYRNGQLLVTAEPAAQINWLVADQLGTPRIIIDKTGARANVKRHDYLPFGEELFAGTGNRTAGIGYSADTVRQKFTSKERDSETGLDYFEARYYASMHGRFTSPDAPFADQSAENPQSWNLYSYVRNNPLVMVDPTGRRAGDYYNTDGSWSYTDGINDNRVYVLNETREADGSINLTPQLLGITHTDFTRSANIVRQEGTTNDTDEYLWIAHASNNEANAIHTTLYNLLQTGFSSAPASVKNTGVATTDISVRANAARAGVLDAVAGGADPTSGARRWDGTDFLAWGLNGPWGSHAKFREFASIHISGQIFSPYENAQIAKWGNSVTYSGTRYTIPAAVFTNAANWTQNRDFHYVTGARNQTRNLVATGAKGQSIFWRF